jgi:hypothetical protein
MPSASTVRRFKRTGIPAIRTTICVEMLTGQDADARREVKATEEAGVEVDPRFKRELAEESGN